MNIVKVKELLEQWSENIETGERCSREKVRKSSEGLSGRIKRTSGQPVIFDSDTYADQQKIQGALCKELPQWADLIRSTPELMDGYTWTRGDFIYLYYSHFRLVVEKLQKIIN